MTTTPRTVSLRCRVADRDRAIAHAADNGFTLVHEGEVQNTAEYDATRVFIGVIPTIPLIFQEVSS